MKKIVVAFILGLVIFSITGCTIPREDADYATVVVTTPNGQKHIGLSTNASIGPLPGAERAFADYSLFKVEDGETASVEFSCRACGLNETVSMTAPAARLFSCNCPEEMDENDNIREYVVVVLNHDRKVKDLIDAIK